MFKHSQLSGVRLEHSLIFKEIINMWDFAVEFQTWIATELTKIVCKRDSSLS